MIEDDKSNNNIPNSEQLVEQQQPLSKKHKIVAGILVVFGVFVFVAWIVQLKNSISSPFAYKGNEQNQSNNATTENNDEALKTKDSDKDGLSDWDELNVHHTSPYLEDSDSDGFSDKQEVDNGKDPNCPAGRDCSVDQTNQQATTTVNSNINNVNAIVGTQPVTTPNLNVSNTVVPVGGQPDTATLRQLLFQNGMKKDDLDKISDKDLLEAYAETASNTQ
ncbi:hypothetical protein KKC67_00200 [Patescibacteria group bacterium]|nr:hypothetical protein [Patescibacteria group bacterium]MBU0879744.1 hypothetical protein [Patescibacteria group bacterium]MBU0880215.1 hypothetical protein [Patescibacteria group bacterium]MBU0897672.1 hypothetical protein [Patescibacteria group bacterium]MBU1062749.1 hypothetical protein [Patescibacteria group bacterium]